MTFEADIKDCPTFEAQLVASDNSQDTSPTTFDNIDEKRLIRRIDFILLPWLAVLYTLSILDRSGIGNARLYGLEQDLDMPDAKYSIALSMFFVSYALLETPSNIVLKRLRPSVWLSTIMLCWGIVLMCHGFVKNFNELLSLRILLGVFEAGFLPGGAYYLSCWYKRNEIGLRLAIFFTSVMLAGAFGGLIAAAISNMNGLGGKPAWAWIFIVEGGITVIAGLASYFILQDFPDSARFLSDRERSFVIRRLQMDNQFSAGGERFQWRSVWKSLLDYKTWLGSMMLIGVAGPGYSFILFLPTIINELGFTATRSNLLTVPYILALIVSCITGHMADRLRKRSYFYIALIATAGASYVILLCSRLPALSYFATYITALGILSCNSHVLSWVSNNVEGQYKRAVTLAVIITNANLSAIAVPYCYRAGDAPWYTLGHAVMLIYVGVGFMGSVAMFCLLRRENTRRDRGERDEVIGDSKDGDVRNGCYASMEDAKRDKGDHWSGFRYIT